MSEVKWIKITTNMFEDEKIDFIESLPESDAILVIWIKLLAQAGKTNSNGFIFLTEQIPYNDEMLAHKFRRSLNVVKLALQTLKQLEMIQYNEEGFLKIANWEKHQNIEGLDKIREQTRLRVEKHREKQKELEGNKERNVTVTQGNERELELELELDKTIVQPEEEKPTKKTIDLHFEKVWSELIPEMKRGKGQISDGKKTQLYKSGDEFKRCVSRYLLDVNKRRIKQPDLNYQMGSTFINSGYVDYLDENVETEIKKDIPKQTISFDNRL